MHVAASFGAAFGKVVADVSSQSVLSKTCAAGCTQTTWELFGSPKPSLSVSAYQIVVGLRTESSSSQSVPVPTLLDAIFRYDTVVKPDDALRKPGDVAFVRHDDHRVATLVQIFEEIHDFVARGRVEVAGRLVRE